MRLLPGLRVRIDPGPGHEPLVLRVDAQIDRDRNTLFLDSHAALTTKAGAGAAIAAHFAQARSHVGHTWRDVWEEGLVKAEAGTALTSAGQRDREERQRLAEELRRRARLTPPAAPVPQVKPAPQRGTGPAVPGDPTGFLPSPRSGSAPVPAPATPGPGNHLGPQRTPVARPLVDAVVFDVLPGKVTRTGAPSTPGGGPPGPRGRGDPRPTGTAPRLPSPGPAGPRPAARRHRSATRTTTRRNSFSRRSAGSCENRVSSWRTSGVRRAWAPTRTTRPDAITRSRPTDAQSRPN